MFEQIGIGIIRINFLAQGYLLEFLAPYAKDSLERTEMKISAKAYKKIGLGGMKLPDAVNGFARKLGIAIFVATIYQILYVITKALV